MSDILLTVTRDTKSALSFLKKTNKENGKPSLVNIDQNGLNKAGLKQINETITNALKFVSANT